LIGCSGYIYKLFVILSCYCGATVCLCVGLDNWFECCWMHWILNWLLMDLIGLGLIRVCLMNTKVYIYLLAGCGWLGYLALSLDLLYL